MVRYLTPNSTVARITRRRFSVPALCPARRGNRRESAQRPLPSMMMAMWRGNLSAGMFRGVSGIKFPVATTYPQGKCPQVSKSFLHLHNFGFFSLPVLGNLFNKAVGQLLKVGLAAFQVVLRDQSFFFEIAHVIM